MSRSSLPRVVVAAGLALAAALPAQEPDVVVRFDEPGEAIAPGVLTGLNDLQNASPGVWKAWREAVHPEDGVVRLWVQYHLGKLDDRHFEAAAQAQAAGLGLYLTFLGDPEHRMKPTPEDPLRAPDPERWAQQVARDVKRFQEKGFAVEYLEIWNEPDLAKNWAGDPESFARFFAEAGAALRPLVSDDVRIGGPSMASNFGGGLRLFREIADACVQVGFQPDFLSWHEYNGFPMDEYHYSTARKVRDIVRSRNLPMPELVLSEWNIGLPSPVNLSLDDHRAAVNFVAMTTALAYSPVKHSLFFMLQDGTWEAKRDYAGQSVGVFTIHGLPKSVLAGMRMTRRAGALPAVPVEYSDEVTPNFGVLATRDGERGFLVATSLFGKEEKHLRKLVEWLGVDPTTLKGRDRAIQGYVTGRVPYDRTGLPQRQKPVWDRVREEMKALAREKSAQERWLTLRLEDAPAHVVGVWVIDRQHGNPRDDADFRERVEPFERGWFPNAAEMTLRDLERGGADAAVMDTVRQALEAKSLKPLDALDPDTRRRVRDLFEKHARWIQDELPSELVRHPATFPAPVDRSQWVRMLDDGSMQLKVPPFSAVMVELSWGSEQPAADSDD